MKLFLTLTTSLLLSACAPYASEVSAIPISTTQYDDWNCQKLGSEQAFVDAALAKVSSDEDHAASHDALMVFLVGFPTSGGGVKEQVAYLKGQQIALRNALMSHGCTGLR